MLVTVSAALLLVALTFGTIRWAAHKPSHALVAFLAGFFVAGTGAAPYIQSLIHAVTRAVTHH
ncbi:MAG TPA: hypothetical protein VGX23_14180 [Actinocrinis sp.]|nr:hypothetical protein [Actinocrinis sp.]